MRKARGLFLALVLALGACGAEDGPADTYRSYLSALAAGDLELAFELLSESSRNRLAAAEISWKEKRGRPGASTEPTDDGSPAGFEFFRIRIAGPHGEDYPPLPEDAASLVESVQEEGGRARVRVRTPLGPREARMVSENGEWRVELAF